MNALIAIAAVRALPPPPEPTSNPTIDTARVIGIVLISLGLIALVTLLLRPLVVRRHAHLSDPADEAEPPQEPAETTAEPPAERGIIRFPTPFSTEAVSGWQVNDPAVADRFQRVVGQRDRRRKLGDRNPSRTFGPSELSPDRRSREPERSYLPRHGAQPIGTVIPIYDRPAAQAADARATGTAELGVTRPPFDRPDRVWTEPQSGARPLDRTRGDNPRRPLAPARREHDSERVEPEFPPAAAPMSAEDVIGHPAAVHAVDAMPAEPRPIDQAPHTETQIDPVGLTAKQIASLTRDAWIVTEEPVWADAEPVAEEHGELGAKPGNAGDSADVETIAVDKPSRQTDQRVLDSAYVDEPDAADAERPTEEPAKVDERAAPPEAAVAPELAVSGGEIDPDTLHEITLAIRELIFCANTGEALRGLALYSDDHLFRFMDSTGMSEDEFREAFAAALPRAPETWERLDTLRDPTRLPDGRIEATASYVDPRGVPSNGIERYRFVYEPKHRLWMIDDIFQLPSGDE